MNQRRCHGCDRSSSSLLTANCGHKTCFYCIRDNRSAHKCTKCCQQANHANSTTVSPAKNKNSATKSQHIRSQQTKIWGDYSPINNKNDQAATNKKEMSHEIEHEFIISQNNVKNRGDSLVCPQHRQPFSMFCRSSKQILCSMCLCRKTKFRDEILPLKNAEEFLKKQNKVFREQARIALSDVQHAWRIVNRNRQIFQQTMQAHKAFINNFFNDLINKLKIVQQNSINYCGQYLKAKIDEYAQISDDLSYLADTLKDFRQNVQENNTLNEQTFLYTSFKVIKKTLSTLTFDYISYENTVPISLVSINEELVKKIQREVIGFKLDLKIKESENSKSRSTSLKSVKNMRHSPSPDLMLKSKHKISVGEPSSSNKKHKFSLCSNTSVDYSNDQNNLYKKLLKAKYKL